MAWYMQAISSLLKNRLGTCDVPLVGQDRYMLVETPIGTSSNSFVTEEVVVEEDSLVRMVEERAAKGLLFASSTLSLATFEQMQAGDCLVLLEPLALDAGVDFESVLENVRERAMEGWRFRGGLQGRLQVQDYVLGYAAYPGVVVTPFSHVVLAKDKNAHRLQVEMVELRACGSVISGSQTLSPQPSALNPTDIYDRACGNMTCVESGPRMHEGERERKREREKERKRGKERGR